VAQRPLSLTAFSRNSSSCYSIAPGNAHPIFQRLSGSWWAAGSGSSARTISYGRRDILRLGASLERAGEHPLLAEAMVRDAKDKDITFLQTDTFKSVTGKGVTGKVDGKTVALGSLKNLEILSINPANLPRLAQAGREEGQTLMFVAMDGRAAGLIGVADPIKDSTPGAIADLHKEGMQVGMLIGDNLTTAQSVAGRLIMTQLPVHW